MRHKNTDRLRIVQIIEATLGGTGRHVLDIIEALYSRHITDVHLIHSLHRADATYQRRMAGLPCGLCVRPVHMQRAIHPSSDLAALLAITAYLRHVAPVDAVHVHSSKAGALGAMAARLAGVPRIVFTPNAFASSGATGRQRQIYLALERICGYLAHAVVAVSQEEYDYAIKQRIAPAHRLHMVPNSIRPPDPTAFQCDRERLRVGWGIASTTRLIGSIGRLTAQKDPLLFVEVIARRASRFAADEEMYLIGGDGELFADIRAAVMRHGLANRVILAGFRTDVDAVLASLDIYVLHSRYEGMPYTVLEAMGHALPIVTTRVAGVAEPLRDGGIIVEIGDAAALDAALDQLCDPQRRVTMGTANQYRLAADYSIGAMINALLTIYQGG